MMKKRSNLDMIGAGRFKFALRDLAVLYLPFTGFAAARIDALALSVAWIPAFAMEIVCCSIAS